jgi:hypothetical protein
MNGEGPPRDICSGVDGNAPRCTILDRAHIPQRCTTPRHRPNSPPHHQLHEAPLPNPTAASSTKNGIWQGQDHTRAPSARKHNPRSLQPPGPGGAATLAAHTPSGSFPEKATTKPTCIALRRPCARSRARARARPRPKVSVLQGPPGTGGLGWRSHRHRLQIRRRGVDPGQRLRFAFQLCLARVRLRSVHACRMGIARGIAAPASHCTSGSGSSAGRHVLSSPGSLRFLATGARTSQALHYLATTLLHLISCGCRARTSAGDWMDR